MTKLLKRVLFITVVVYGVLFTAAVDSLYDKGQLPGAAAILVTVILCYIGVATIDNNKKQ